MWTLWGMAMSGSWADASTRSGNSAMIGVERECAHPSPIKPSTLDVARSPDEKVEVLVSVPQCFGNADQPFRGCGDGMRCSAAISSPRR